MVEKANALDENDDRTIWHYTNGAGFLGILRSHSIWASSLLFLNDSAEIYHTFKTARDFASYSGCDELDKRLIDLAIDHAGGSSGNVISAVMNVSIFAASFSLKSDDLNQWRGYASNSGGYCVGFSPSTLREFGAKQGFGLERVRYQRDEQYQLIQPVVGDFLTESRKLSLSIEQLKGLDGTWPWENVHETLPRLVDNFLVKLKSIAPVLKHQSFAEEEEWRLVSQIGRGSTYPVEFSDTDRGLVPYVPVALSEPDEIMNLRAVIIGPSPRSHLNLLASTWAGQRHNVKCPSMATSSLPFRNW